MRQLTLKGFLRQYIKQLSYSRVCDIRVLAKEVPEGSYRLVEPLVLYALSIGKENYLRRVSEDSILITEAFRFEGMSFDSVISLLESESINEIGIVPYNYIKAYQSYVLYRDKQKNQNHSKMLMRDKINKIKKQKNMSVYRIYTDLGLNHGCVHDYLKNGNVKGIGINTARRILEYLKVI